MQVTGTVKVISTTKGHNPENDQHHGNGQTHDRRATIWKVAINRTATITY
jgi:hypothetical protein